MQLSIIVPAYNEESRIGPMLERYVPYFTARYGDRFELIVVVNGSRDRTAEVTLQYARQNPVIRCLVEPGNIGKGGALLMGFAVAKGQWIGFVDADGATPPEAYDDLVKHIGQAAAIIASRWTRGAKVSPRQPLDRRLASRLFNTLVRILFGLRLTDTQCGAKLMRRDVLLPLLPRFGITRWAFDVDLLYQIKRAGGRIVEIPTTWSDVAGSKLQVGRASVEMLLALVRLRLLYSPFRGLVPLFGPKLFPFVRLPSRER
ncbi:MAG: glycosyltransferase family 2 protein [Lentisphaerae bacterium]|nr:glycosyltransferase family 2 protein [Lentisphaerota bacterium]